jgi:uncharacterized membrane protein
MADHQDKHACNFIGLLDRSVRLLRLYTRTIALLYLFFAGITSNIQCDITHECKKAVVQNLSDFAGDLMVGTTSA